MYLRRAIDQFEIGYFETTDRSDKTIRAYIADLKQFHKFLDKNFKLTSITPEMVESYAVHLKKEGYAPASMQRKLMSLKVFFNYWVRKRTIPNSPFWHLKLNLDKAQTLPKALSMDEIQRLLQKAHQIANGYTDEEVDAMGAGFLAIRNVALLEVMFATGMRVGEVSALNVQDFEPNERVIVVQGKGDKQRLAFLQEETSYQALMRYLSTREQLPLRTDAIFVNNFQKRLSPQGVGVAVNLIAEKAGIPQHITPHMLRHTAATLLLRAGADLRIVQEFLGHASITTTQRYTHLTKDHLRDALKSLHPGKGMDR